MIIARKRRLAFLLSFLMVWMAIPFAGGGGRADAATYEDLTYEVSGDTVSITGCSESATSVTIPEKIDGRMVTSIGSEAFLGCGDLTDIRIPDSVTSIGDGAFCECSSLASITIPDGVTDIAWFTFKDCRSLTSITIPDSVTSIGFAAFYRCSSLSNITIPDGVTSIANSVFFGCSSLVSITIPDSVTNIDTAAFCDCGSLVSITIPDNVTSIGFNAFFLCSGLTNITIPDSVASINAYAFRGCSSLKSIRIPSNVTSISSATFDGCSDLTSITIPKGVSHIEEEAFYDCDSLADVYYQGSLEDWNRIQIDSGNEKLMLAKIYYNGSLPTDEEAAEAVETKITAIGEVTADSGDVITAVRGAYDALTDEQKALVSEEAKATLTAAEAAYAEAVAAKEKAEADARAAEDVESKIAAIREVTADSGDVITAAREAYGALTDEQKALVSEEAKATLTAAEAAYAEAVAAKEKEEADARAAGDVESKIAAIGEVTADSGDIIAASRGAYDALTDEQKALVSEEAKATLTAAEAAYAEAVAAKEKAEADARAAEDVESKIAAIREVTADSGDVITAAREAYGALTDEQKALVSEEAKATLTAAEAAYAEAVAAKEKAEADARAAGDVEAKIAVIGEVTKDSGEAIKAAREAYDTLTEEQKNLIPAETLKLLTDAEAAYEELQKIDEPVDNPFIDVHENDYFFQPVAWAVRKEITNGTSETTFSPADTCTRGQAVTFLWRAAGSEKVSGVSNPFTDVKSTDYYYDAVLWAYKNGVTSGTTESTFSPADTCNRGQIVTFLWRTEQKPKSDVKVSFTDVSSDAYYYAPVKWAVEHDVTKGTTTTTFSPNDSCTRGQIVTFLYRSLS